MKTRSLMLLLGLLCSSAAMAQVGGGAHPDLSGCTGTKPTCGVCEAVTCGGAPDWEWECTASASGTTCNDGNACTYNDKCNGHGTCAGTAVSCVSTTCTNITCNGTSTCSTSDVAPGTTCFDGNFCDTGETCNGSGSCTGGTPVNTSGDVTHFQVTGLYTNTVTSGVSNYILIEALNSSNQIVSAYQGNVGIAVSGVTSTLPPSVTLSSGSAAVAGTLTASSPPGAATITVTGPKESTCDASAPTAGIATITVAAAPTTPTITLSANYLNSGATGSASIPAQSGMGYSWSISGGTISGSSTSTTVNFIAGSSGTVSLTATVLNAATPAATAAATKTVNICAAPAQAFNNASCVSGTISATSPVTVGNQTSITWTVSSQPSGSYIYQVVSGGALVGSCPATSPTTATLYSSGAIPFSLVATPTCSSTSGVTIANTTATAVAVPSVPVISVPSALASGAAGVIAAPNQNTITASVPSQGSGVTFQWSATGNITLAATTGYSVTFSTGNPGSGTLRAIATNAASYSVESAGTFYVASPATFTLPGNTLVTSSPTPSQTISWSATPLPSGFSYALVAGGTTYCESATGSYSYAPVAGTTNFQLVAAPSSCPATSVAQVAALSVTAFDPPAPQITAPPTMLATDAPSVSVQQRSDFTYAWSIEQGTLSSQTIYAPTMGALSTNSFIVLNCTVTNGAGMSVAAEPVTVEVTCGDGMQFCGSSCIPDTACCTNSDCAAPTYNGVSAGNAYCVQDGGVGTCSNTCSTSAGYQQCNDSCIPIDGGCCE